MRYYKEIIFFGGREELVAQTRCGCLIPGSIQGQIRWCFEQPGLVQGGPAHGRRVGTRLSLRSPKHSMIISLLVFFNIHLYRIIILCCSVGWILPEKAF